MWRTKQLPQRHDVLRQQLVDQSSFVVCCAALHSLVHAWIWSAWRTVMFCMKRKTRGTALSEELTYSLCLQHGTLLLARSGTKYAIVPISCTYFYAGLEAVQVALCAPGLPIGNIIVAAVA